MVSRKVLTSVVVSFFLGACGAVWAGLAEEAAASMKKGDELLANADFDGALKAYASAARTDSANQDYRAQYAILRRVIGMREDLAREQNPRKWETSARALHSFYLSRKIYSEALDLGRRIHDRLNTAESAAMLAESLLGADRNQEAEQVLAGLGQKATPQTDILLGIAQARQQKLDQARAAAGKITLPADADAGIVFDLACLKALLGDKAGSAALLTRCFEMIPPSRLETVKEHARESKDLAAIAGSPEFAEALKTQSKAKESGCSGGTSCGSCSKKGGCTSSADKKSCDDHKEAAPEKK